jgi:amino acid adenylation domain-containing protein
MRHAFAHQMFQQTAADRPEATAISGSGRRLSYRALDEWSDELAGRLIRAGLRKRAIVYLAVDSSFTAAASILAVLKAGGVFVPIDPHQPAARLRTLTAQVPPALCLAEEILAATVADKLGGATTVIPADPAAPAPPGARDGADRAEWAPDDMCYVYFTSGSTGRPKAIAGRLKAIDHFVRWEIEELAVTPDTRVSQLTSLTFDAFLRDLFTPLAAGGTMCVPDGRETILDPGRLIDWLDTSRIEIVHTVPSLFRTMLAEPLRPERFAALRYVLLAGEPLLPADVERWTQVFGARIPLINLYGPTETTMVKLFYRVQPSDAARRSIPIGRPMPGAQVLLLDDAGRPVERGAPGEIHLQTEYRTLGYYDNPELTEQVFVPNPLGDDPDDIVYRTGDLARELDDGNLEFLGRKDQQVKIRGVRIELGEVENAILATGAIKEVAAVSQVDRIGNSYLCAYVVADHESVERARRVLSTTLPDYMIPSSFIELEWLPRTSTGKIDRKSLPAPEQARSAAVEPIAPRNDLEARAARLFAEALGAASVGVNEDFFQLGGHSLLAMSLLARLSAEFDVELPLATLFEHPTVERLVRAVEDRRDPVAAADGDDRAMPPDAPAPGIDELSDADLESLLAEVLDGREARS